MIKRRVKGLLVGEKFVYGKKNCLVLEHMDDGTLCMVLDEDFNSAFGENNNFAESELRKKLNIEYLNEWVDSGARRKNFVSMVVNLTANDGLKDYGTCECFLAPRTCDQHRKYRYLIPNPEEDWELTPTAYSTKSNGCSNVAYRVTGSGGLNYNCYYVSDAGVVRPLFKLNSESLVECEIKIKTEWDNGTVEDAISHLQSAVDTLNQIDGYEAEMSITLNVIKILEEKREKTIEE